MPQTGCNRCGACCIKGGPALHKEDISLLFSKSLSPVVLITIRKGEPVYHPTENRLVELPMDIIKIKSKPSKATCLFFNEVEMACSIYQERPLECRAFKCWDTQEAEGLFLTDILAREDIFPPNSALLELIHAYDQRFPPKEIFSMIFEAKDLLNGAKETLAALEEIAKKDNIFRKRVKDTFGIHDESLGFFLGRSVAELHRQYGLFHN